MRVFFSSDDLQEAISVRTQIQAQIAESGRTPKMKDTGFGNGMQDFGNEIDEKSACLIDNRKARRKKKANEIILGILIENSNQMGIEDLKEKALKMDIGKEQFEDCIKKLKDTRELYSPSNDVIRIV